MSLVCLWRCPVIYACARAGIKDPSWYMDRTAYSIVVSTVGTPAYERMCCTNCRYPEFRSKGPNPLMATMIIDAAYGSNACMQGRATRRLPFFYLSYQHLLFYIVIIIMVAAGHNQSLYSEEYNPCQTQPGRQKHPPPLNHNARSNHCIVGINISIVHGLLTYGTRYLV